MRAPLLSAGPHDFARLREAYAGADPIVFHLLDELQESAFIYRLFEQEQYFENNRRRIQWMKHHLHEYRSRRGDDDYKVLFKMGSAHTGRGYSPFLQLDVGNHAAEWAAGRGGDSFHLYVLAPEQVSADGQRVDFRQGGGAFLGPLFEQMEEGAWSVFDLRPLRPYFSPPSRFAGQRELAEFVFRHDAVALAPLFHAAVPLVAEPDSDG